MKLSTLLSGALAFCAATLTLAQTTSPYKDPKSNITFQYYRGSLSFGIALPENATDEFIGQLVGKKDAWVGLSFGGAMLNALLMVAWNSGQNIIHDFRFATSFMSPPLYNRQPAPVLTPLKCGTGVNSTHWTLTFTCKNCHDWVTGGFELSAESTSFGWAVANSLPTNPSQPGGSVQKHSAQGRFGVVLSAAGSADYDKWKTECA